MAANIIGLKELRANANRYIAEVAHGKSFTVVRRSKPVFTIAPVVEESEAGWSTVIDFTALQKGGISAEDLLARLSKRSWTKSTKRSRN